MTFWTFAGAAMGAGPYRFAGLVAGNDRVAAIGRVIAAATIIALVRRLVLP